MTKLTTSQYAIFMIAALTILIAVPSAYAATFNVDPLCDDADPNTPVCDDPATYRTIKSAIGAADPNDTISISAGTYDEGRINVNKALTIEPAANERVVLDGASRLYVYSNDVTIKGITFKNTTSVYAITIGKTASDVTIHNNTLADTRGGGINTANAADTLIQNLAVTDNVFENIGTFYEPGLNVTQKAKKLHTAMYFSTSKSNLGGLQDSKITGNIIDTTTFSGIILSGAENILVENNKISNVPAPAINVKSDVDQIQILDNDIRNANNALRYLNGVPEDTTEGAIVLWAKDASHVTVSNNTVSGGNNGIVYCTGICGVSPNELGNAKHPGHIIDKTAKTNSTNTFTRNTFDNVNGFDIINMALGVMVATHNYYGDSPDFAAAISGLVQYSPYYADYVGGELRAMGPAKQQSLADVQRTDICSIGLERYNLYFDDAAWGTESSAENNAVLNTGDIVLTGVKIQTGGWLDEKDNPVAGAKTTVADILVGNFLDLLSTNPDGIDMNANLPAPDTDEKLDLQFTIDLTGKATGPDSQIRETISFAGSCS